MWIFLVLKRRPKTFAHRMQIWRTTRSSPGTSYMKARLVSLQSFNLTMLPPKNSCFVVDLFCFISLCLRVAVFLNATRRDRNLQPFTSKGKECINAIRWDEEKKFTIAAGTKVSLLRFRTDDLKKNRLNDKLKLCGVWWCSNTIVMTNTFPKLKKSSSWKISSVSKEEVICVRVHSHGIARNKYYDAITKQMNFKYPVVETSESIEPNDNDLELNAIGCTFSKISQPELKQLFARPH